MCLSPDTLASYIRFQSVLCHSFHLPAIDCSTEDRNVYKPLLLSVSGATEFCSATRLCDCLEGEMMDLHFASVMESRVTSVRSY